MNTCIDCDVVISEDTTICHPCWSVRHARPMSMRRCIVCLEPLTRNVWYCATRERECSKDHAEANIFYGTVTATDTPDWT